MTFIVIAAFALEALIGYPHWLYNRILHPVVWMGAGIAFFERKFNNPRWSAELRRAQGGAVMILLLAMVVGLGALMSQLGQGLVLFLMAPLFATRSLYDHVREVYVALAAANLELAREKVGHIVGRDVRSLDRAGVARAAIESLAESFSDGIVAPFFWAACLGLPGIACYKIINTADSMIGHKTERYREFGWAAAKLDDLANFIPSRLSGILIALVSGGKAPWKIMWRDAAKHASPNAGWPEAAMAGALGLQLGGPNLYDGELHDGAYLGDGSREATASHLARALRLYIEACVMLPLGWLALRVLL